MPLTARQVEEWRAFERLEPFGQVRDDWRMANFMKLVADLGGVKDTKVSDFLPFHRDPPPPKPGSPEFEAQKKNLQASIKGVFTRMAAAFDEGKEPNP